MMRCGDCEHGQYLVAGLGAPNFSVFNALALRAAMNESGTKREGSGNVRSSSHFDFQAVYTRPDVVFTAFAAISPVRRI